jgi:hypothetical protein
MAVELIALACLMLAAAPAARAHSIHGGRALLGAKAGKWCPTGTSLTPQDIIAREEIFYVSCVLQQEDGDLPAPLRRGRAPFPCSTSASGAPLHCPAARCWPPL